MMPTVLLLLLACHTLPTPEKDPGSGMDAGTTDSGHFNPDTGPPYGTGWGDDTDDSATVESPPGDSADTDGTTGDTGETGDSAGGTVDTGPFRTGDWLTVTTGWFFTCGTRGAGETACWGDPDIGGVLPEVEPLTGLSAGAASTCGIGPDGKPYCWGYARDGVLDAPSVELASVHCGSEITDYVVGIQPDQSLVHWGERSENTTLPSGSFTSVAVGMSACAIDTAGTLVCWSEDDRGYYPVEEQAPVTGTWAQVDVGWNVACAIDTSGALTCWGDGDASEDRIVTDQPSGVWQSVSLGIYMACAISIDESIDCWGGSPVFSDGVPPDTYASVTAGYEHACGITTHGAILCWGNDSSGETVPPP